MDGVALVREARRRAPDLEAVAVTGRDDVRLAVQAMKAGCADFLMKPLEVDELVEVAERALGRVQLRREHSRLVSENLDLTRAQALYRQGLQILSTLDGERLQDVALSVLARVTDAQGAALWTADERGHLQLRAYRGVVDRAALPARVDPAAAEWAGPLRGGAPFPAPFAGAGEGFLVALVADDEPVGVALLSDRAAGSFGPEEHQAATTIADFTAIAVKNAWACASARRAPTTSPTSSTTRARSSTRPAATRDRSRSWSSRSTTRSRCAARRGASPTGARCATSSPR
jgi:hypothetical protein